MKKILTLLIAASAFLSLHAQSREETRRVILGNPKDDGTYGGNRDVILGGGNGGQYPSYPNNYPNNYPNGGYGNDRQYQVDQINREYSAKIQSIENNPYLSRAEKERAIRQLERDRQLRIDEISRQYNNRYERYDNARYDRHDNGKHKGWYKNGKDQDWKYGRRDRD